MRASFRNLLEKNPVEPSEGKLMKVYSRVAPKTWVPRRFFKLSSWSSFSLQQFVNYHLSVPTCRWPQQRLLFPVSCSS